MISINWAVGVTLNVLLIGWCIYAVRTYLNERKSAARTLGVQATLISVAFVLFYAVDPLWFSKVVYLGAFLHAFESVVVAIALIPAWYAWGLVREKKRRATGSSFFLLALGIGTAGTFVSNALSEWQTAEAYKFAKRSDLVVTSPDAVRYTPLFVARNEIVQRLNESAFTVLPKETDAVEWNGHLAYVAPLTPDGLINALTEPTDGLMVYDDHDATADRDRVSRIRLPWRFGEGMQIWDNMYRMLARSDPFAQYGNGYYVRLESGEIIAAVPKLKYRWRFLWRVPYWHSTVLVYPDGKTEEISAGNAIKDPRFGRARLFPEELARYIVYAQKFDMGPLSGLYNRRGKIKVPELPLQNQMPYLMEGADGEQYWITATEPAGQSAALFRMYYINGRTGERSVFEWDPDQGVLGPERGIQRVKSLPGYNWVDPSSGAGDFHVLEAIAITRPQDPNRLWWKYTITTAGLTGVVKTVVVDSSGANEEILPFTSRAQFSAWLHGKKLTTEEAEDPLQKAIDEVDSVKKRLQELQRSGGK